MAYLAMKCDAVLGADVRRRTTIRDTGRRDRLLTEVVARGVEDLVVFSHGWNSDRSGATRLYSHFFAPFPELAPAAKLRYRGGSYGRRMTALGRADLPNCPPGPWPPSCRRARCSTRTPGTPSWRPFPAGPR